MLMVSCKGPKFITQTVTKDSIVYKDTVVYRDVPVLIKPDSGVTIKDSLPGLPKDYQAHGEKTTGHKTASYDIKDGKININCHDQEYLDTIKNLKIQLQNKEQYHSSVTTQQIPVKEIVYKTPTWVKWLIGIEVAGVVAWGYFGGWLTPILSVFKNLFSKIISKFKK